MLLSRRMVLALLMLLVCLVLFSNATFLARGELKGWQVDTYTQKEPYSGVGLNEPSDAFEEGETVALYANVTYNEAPVQNALTTFLVKGPPNLMNNITLSLTAVSNDAGIAEANFTIPWPNEQPETAVFGNWTVRASVENSSDLLSFKVGRMVEVVFLHVVDQDPPQGGLLFVEVLLRSITMTSKNVTHSLSMCMTS